MKSRNFRMTNKRHCHDWDGFSAITKKLGKKVQIVGDDLFVTNTDFVNTRNAGIVKGAGFIVKGAANAHGSHDGAVQFIVARHFVSRSTDAGYPIFTANDSFATTASRLNPDPVAPAGDHVNLVRAMLFTATGSCFQLLQSDQQYPSSAPTDANRLTTSSVGTTTGESMYKRFKLVLSLQYCV